MNSLKWLLAFLMLGHSATVVADEGGDIYRQVCAVCHAPGVAGDPGVPRLGVRADWIGRVATGKSGLLHSVLRGKGAMPPKGGDASLSDTQAKAALDYMLSKIDSRNMANGSTQPK